MPYQIAAGWNNAGSLADFTHQPASPEGQKYPEVRYDGEGGAIPVGYLQDRLVWTGLMRSEYNTVLTQCGLSLTTFSAKVTVRLQKNDDTFANANAIAIYTQRAQRDMGFWRNLEILMNRVEWL